MDEKRLHAQQLALILKSGKPVAVIRQRYEAEVLEDDSSWHWGVLYTSDPHDFAEVTERKAREIIADRGLVLKVDIPAGQLYDTPDEAYAKMYRSIYRREQTMREKKEAEQAALLAAAAKYGGRKGVHDAVLDLFRKGGNARYIADELGIHRKKVIKNPR